MKKLILLAVLLAALTTGFYFWASSPAVGPEGLVFQSEGCGGPPPRAPEMFRIVTYNAGYFSGMANSRPEKPDPAVFQRNIAAAARALEALKPDVVAMQEVDFDSARSHGQDQMAALAAGLGLEYTAGAVNWNKTYVPFPYWPLSAHFGRMVSGQAIISRWPIGRQQRLILPMRQDKPFYYRALYIQRMAQCAVIDMGRPVVLINLHLESWDTAARREQARRVIELARSMRGRGDLVIVGDFNTVPPWATQKTDFPDEFQDYRGDDTLTLFMHELGLRPAIPRRPEAAAEADTLSFPSDAPTRKLDHVLYDPAAMELVSARVVHEAGQSSDHYPVTAVLRFKN